MDDLPEIVDELARRVRSGLADLHPVGPEPDLAAVRHRGQRRRRGTRVLAGLGIAAVLAAGGAVVADLARDDGEDGSIVTEEPEVPSTVAPTGTDPESSTPPTPSTQPSNAVVSGAAAAGPTSVATDRTGTGGSIVAWGGGFLRVRTEGGGSTIPALTDEIRAYFPQSVLELFPEPPGTIDEALEILNQHPDQLAIVQEILTENPDVNDAIYGPPAPTFALFETSDDGVTWTEAGRAELPAPLTWVAYSAAHDGRLAVVGQGVDAEEAAAFEPGASPRIPVESVVIATTTDLSTWESVQVLDAAKTDAPIGFTPSRYVVGLDMGPTGVAAVVQEQLNFDPLPLLPDDVRALLQEGGGWGMSTDVDGITLQIGGPAVVAEAPGRGGVAPPVSTATAGEDDSQELFFTWDELGVDPELANQPPSTIAVWAGDPVEGLALDATSGLLVGPSAVVAADGGGYVSVRPVGDGVSVWTSLDGRTWSDVVLDSRPGWYVQSVVDTPGGVLVTATDWTSWEGWLSSPDLLTWEPVEVPLTSGSMSLAYGAAGGADGTAVVRVITPEVEEAAPVAGVVTMERDGYVLTVTIAGDEMAYRVVRLAADGSEEVLLEIDGREFFESEQVQLGDAGDLTILDESGTPLVTFSEAEATAAYAEAFPDSYVDGEGDMSSVQVYELLHSGDGRTWTVLDRIESGGPGSIAVSPLAVAVNGDRVVWVTERWSESGEMSPDDGEQTRVYDVSPG